MTAKLRPVERCLYVHFLTLCDLKKIRFVDNPTPTHAAYLFLMMLQGLYLILLRN